MFPAVKVLFGFAFCEPKFLLDPAYGSIEFLDPLLGPPVSLAPLDPGYLGRDLLFQLAQAARRLVLPLDHRGFLRHKLLLRLVELRFEGLVF